ncbi:hypothetical protein A2Y99_02315, partial [Candidatus Gottesmanbacteria bacterium RBG_13_37_7]
MRIGIDGRLYAQTGVGRFIRNLIQSLTEIDKENQYVVFLRPEEARYFIPANSRWKKKIIDVPWHTCKEQMIYSSIILKENIDLMHFPYFSLPVFYPKKYLLTIHDLIIDHFTTGKASTLPFFYYRLKRIGYKEITKRAIRNSSWITAISETTKKEIIDHYHKSSSQITVAYDALDENFRKEVKKRNHKKYFPFKYLLYVGNAYPHKNLDNMLQACLKLRKINPGIKLVLVGEIDYFYQRLKKTVEQLNLEKEIVFFGPANDRELV